jgi:hypothetical protein
MSNVFLGFFIDKYTDDTFMVIHSNYKLKYELIQRLLAKIKHRQRGHYDAFRSLRKTNIIMQTTINVLNTISITSIVLLYSAHPTTLIVCTVTSSLSAIGTAIHSVIGLESKYHSHQTSYLQFVDLYDSYQAEVLRDNLTGEDLDIILRDMNIRMGIILDNCEPLSRMYENSLSYNIYVSDDLSLALERVPSDDKCPGPESLV